MNDAAEGDILELPALEPQHKESVVRELTRLLVEADDGSVESFIASVKRTGDIYQVWGSGTSNVHETAGHMIYAALRRMGFVVLEDLDEYVKKDEE